MFCITKAHLYPKDNLWKTSKCKTNQQSYCKETKEDLLENKLVTPSDFRMKKGKKKTYCSFVIELFKYYGH